MKKKTATRATDSTGLHPFDETQGKFLLLVIIQLFLSPLKNGQKIKGKFLPAAIQLLSRYTSGNIIVVPCMPEKASIPAAFSLSRRGTQTHHVN